MDGVFSASWETLPFLRKSALDVRQGSVSTTLAQSRVFIPGLLILEAQLMASFSCERQDLFREANDYFVSGYL